MGYRPSEPDTAQRFFDDGEYVIYLSPRRATGQWVLETWWSGHRKSTRTSTVLSGDTAYLDARQAAKLIRDDYRRGLIEAPELAPVTVQELCEAFASRTHNHKGRALSPKTRRAYETQLQALTRVIAADMPLEHLASRHVRTAVTREGLAPKTAAQYLIAIRAMVRWAVAKRWLSVDVTEGVYVDAGPPQVKDFLQPDEVPAFLDACGPALRIRAGLIIETGMRVGEASMCRPEWVMRGIGRMSIRVPAEDGSFAAKGRQIRPIPLSSAGQSWVAQAQERWPTGPYLLHDRDSIRTDNWSRDVNRACVRAKVTQLSTHGLRRTAGVLWLAAGASIFEVSRLLGHASVTVTEQAYAGIASGQLASVMDRVDAVADVPRLPVNRRLEEVK